MQLISTLLSLYQLFVLVNILLALVHIYQRVLESILPKTRI